MPEPLELQLTVAPKGKKIETRLYCRELGIDAGPFPLKLPLDDKILEELRWYLVSIYARQCAACLRP